MLAPCWAAGGRGRVRPQTDTAKSSCYSLAMWPSAQRVTSELIISKTGPGRQPWAPPAPASPTAFPPRSNPVGTKVSTKGFRLEPHPGVGSSGPERPLAVPETLGRAVALTPAGQAPRATTATWGLSEAEAAELITPRKHSVTLHLHSRWVQVHRLQFRLQPPDTRGPGPSAPPSRPLRPHVTWARLTHFRSALVMSMPWQRCRWLRGPGQAWRVSQTLVGSPGQLPGAA